MRQSVFFGVALTVSLIVSYVIYSTLLPEHVKAGGPLVVLLIALSLLAVTFIIERYIALKRAEGRKNIQGFVKGFREDMEAGRVREAIERCNQQGGALANVLRAGLESFQEAMDSDMTTYEKQDVTRRAIEEANALEAPLLERNLIALSTIASIATMVGLLGTTLGMIRSFGAMATTGAPDAIQLALGISEALVNTAGGLFVAIAAIVAYNYYVNKVDALNYTIDEVAQEMLEKFTKKMRGTRRAQA
ncbi:MAG: MotA/TolQ/ExbB proton channel family protein [bacterium]